MSTLGEKILQSERLFEETLELPEIGETVLIVPSRLGFAFEMVKGDGGVDLGSAAPKMIADCVLDPETREPVFTVAEAEKIAAARTPLMSRLLEAVMRVSGMSADSAAGKAEPSS